MRIVRMCACVSCAGACDTCRYVVCVCVCARSCCVVIISRTHGKLGPLLRRLRQDCRELPHGLGRIERRGRGLHDRHARHRFRMITGASPPRTMPLGVRTVAAVLLTRRCRSARAARFSAVPGKLDARRLRTRSFLRTLDRRAPPRVPRVPPAPRWPSRWTPPAPPPQPPPPSRRGTLPSPRNRALRPRPPRLPSVSRPDSCAS